MPRKNTLNAILLANFNGRLVTNLDNKLGAGGSIGADQVSKAAPDDCRLLFTFRALTITAALRTHTT